MELAFKASFDTASVHREQGRRQQGHHVAGARMTTGGEGAGRKGELRHGARLSVAARRERHCTVHRGRPGLGLSVVYYDNMEECFRCGRCGAQVPGSEFHRSSSRGHQAWCKSCRRAYDADYHRRHAQRRKRQAYRRHRAVVEWYRGLKDAPCVDCGGRFHHAAMQWDHLPGSVKKNDLGRLVNGHSRAVILDEIAKCELVCANCHAVRSYERARGVAQPG